MSDFRRNRIRTMALFVAALTIAAFLAVLTRDDTPDGAVALSGGGATPTATAGAGPIATAPTAPPAPPAPSGSQPSNPGLVGDAVGDLADSEGIPPADGSFADLVGASVVRSGDRLVVTFTLAAPPQSTAEGVLYTVETVVAGERAHNISAQLVGGGVFTGVYDWRTGAQTTLDDATTITGTTLTITVPGDIVADLAAQPFSWRALVQLDGGFEDRLPEDGTVDMAGVGA